MSNKIESFVVGASNYQGKFLALVLKFKLANGETLLSSWDTNGCGKLIEAMSEYLDYLDQNNVVQDPDSVEDKMEQDAPALTQAEVELANDDHAIDGMQIKVNQQHELKLALSFMPPSAPAEIILTPHYAEWLYGYVASTMDNYDEEGNPLAASETTH